MEEKLTAKQRVEDELHEVEEKLCKMGEFIYSANSPYCRLNATERLLWDKQFEVLSELRQILAARLSIWRDFD